MSMEYAAHGACSLIRGGLVDGRDLGVSGIRSLIDARGFEDAENTKSSDPQGAENGCGTAARGFDRAYAKALPCGRASVCVH